MNNKPLTPDEVQAAAEQFFPLFEIVHNRMPANSTTEDSLKVMESVCGLAHKLRVEEEKIKFGFNRNGINAESETVG
jgi:hypothetical protein